MSNPETTSILLVDDHAIVREGLAMLIGNLEGFEVSGQAQGAKDALTLLEQLRVDIVVSDLSMPDRHGLDFINDLLALYPDIKILIISMHDESLYAERSLRAGAKGYIMKEAGPTEFLSALSTVKEGGIYASKNMTQHLMGVFAKKPKESSTHSILNNLSNRELQIFELIGHGQSNQTIAENLGISPRTVDAHKSKMKEKLQLPDNNAVFRQAVQWVEMK